MALFACAIVCKPDEQKRLMVSGGGIRREASFLRDDAGHVHPLRPLGKGAADEEVFDPVEAEAARALDRAAHGGRAEVLGPDVPEYALVRLADGGADAGYDKCFVDLHGVGRLSVVS